MSRVQAYEPRLLSSAPMDGIEDPLDAPLVDPLVDPMVAQEPPPPPSGPSSPSDEKRDYERRQRDGKWQGGGQIDSEEVWSSKGSKSNRKVWRPKEGQGAEVDGSLFGSTMTERTRNTYKSAPKAIGSAAKKALTRKKKKEPEAYDPSESDADRREREAFGEILREGEEAKKKKKKKGGWKDRAGREEVVEEKGGRKKDTTAKLDRAGLNTRTFHVGELGDESGVHIGDFDVDRNGERWGGAEVGSTDHTFEAEDGTQHTVDGERARAGTSTGASTYTDDSTDDVERKRGATAGISAEVESKASIDAIQGEDSAALRAKAAAFGGTRGAAAAGTRTNTKLGGRWSGLVEAGSEVEGSIGVETEAESGVRAAKGEASADARAKGSIGARIAGEGGANAALRIGNTDLVAARAKAKGEAFAGAKAQGEAKAKASLLTGLEGSASGEAMAGAEASGKAVAGVTAGFVDADVAAEGEAFAGARAGAQGEAAINAFGAAVRGGAEAFAGAKVQGEIGVELGADGLNFGKLTVRGKAQAGAGGNVGFDFTAMYGQLEAGAEAGAAVGVGVGVGMQVEADVLFAARLLLQQLAKNGASVAGDVTQSNIDGAEWRVQADEAGDIPTGPLASVRNQLPADVVEQLDERRAAASADVREAFDAVSQLGNETMNTGLTRLGQVVPAVLECLFNAHEAWERAKGVMDDMMASAGAQAESILATVGSLGGQILKEMTSWLARPIHELLELDFVTLVDETIARIHAIVDQIRAAVIAILLQTEQMILEVGAKLGASVLAPVRIIADSAGSVIGQFGNELVGGGLKMIDILEQAFGPIEEGLPVEGLGVSVALPPTATKALAPAKSTFSDAATFFDQAGAGSFGKVIDEIGTPVVAGVFVDAPLAVTRWGKDMVGKLDGVKDDVKPIEDGVRHAAAVVAPAVDAARFFLRGLFGG